MSRTAAADKSLAPAENKALGATTDLPEGAPAPAVETKPDTIRVQLVHFIDGFTPGEVQELPKDRANELIHGNYARAL